MATNVIMASTCWNRRGINADVDGEYRNLQEWSDRGSATRPIKPIEACVKGGGIWRPVFLFASTRSRSNSTAEQSPFLLFPRESRQNAERHEIQVCCLINMNALIIRLHFATLKWWDGMFQGRSSRLPILRPERSSIKHSIVWTSDDAPKYVSPAFPVNDLYDDRVK